MTNDILRTMKQANRLLTRKIVPLVLAASVFAANFLMTGCTVINDPNAPPAPRYGYGDPYDNYYYDGYHRPCSRTLDGRMVYCDGRGGYFYRGKDGYFYPDGRSERERRRDEEIRYYDRLENNGGPDGHQRRDRRDYHDTRRDDHRDYREERRDNRYDDRGDRHDGRSDYREERRDGPSQPERQAPRRGEKRDNRDSKQERRPDRGPDQGPRP